MSPCSETINRLITAVTTVAAGLERPDAPDAEIRAALDLIGCDRSEAASGKVLTLLLILCHDELLEALDGRL